MSINKGATGSPSLSKRKERGDQRGEVRYSMRRECSIAPGWPAW